MMTLKRYCLAMMLPMAFVVSGCGTPFEVKAARSFAKFQAQSADLFPKIANDAYQTCIRSLDYVTLNRPSVDNSEGPETIDEDRKKREAVCDSSEPGGSIAVRDAFERTHDIIHDYIVALGQLAADDLTDFDSEVTAIGTSIQQLPGLSEGENKNFVSAGTSLANFLFGAFTNSYRRDELEEAIVTVDPHLMVLVVALDTSVEQHYVNDLLVTERRVLDSYYNQIINSIVTQPEGQNLAVQRHIIEDLKSTWSQKQEIIRQKQTIASQYLDLLKNIACDHSNLKDMFLGADAERYLREPFDCEQVAGLESLFSSAGNLSPEAVTQRIEDYSMEVTVLNARSKELFKDESE